MNEIIENKDSKKELIKNFISLLQETIINDRKTTNKLLKKFINDYNNKENLELDKLQATELQRTITKILEAKQRTTENLIKLFEVLTKNNEIKTNEINLNINIIKKRGIDFNKIELEENNNQITEEKN